MVDSVIWMGKEIVHIILFIAFFDDLEIQCFWLEKHSFVVI